MMRYVRYGVRSDLPEGLIQYEGSIGCAVLGVCFGQHTPKNFTLDIRGCRDLVVAPAEYILSNTEAFLNDVRSVQEKKT